ncbi:MAG: helix-turn-helix domain-containing protein [Actinobacteria bacterium]|nr:helix-turn-helix domain-containing protein [Actinomycetota bacterium]
MTRARDREFADALREAIEARGLSLERVRVHLLSYGHDVSVATLSYWQTGRSLPVRRASLQALGALEAILQVPRGSLAAKLPSQHGRRTEATATPLPTRHQTTTGLGRIAARMGIGFNDGFTIVSHEQTVTIGADREFVGAAMDVVIQATRDGLDRLLVGLQSDVPGVLIDVVPVAGCRIGQTAAVLNETVTVVEVLLDQPLRTGEPYRYRILAHYDTPGTVVRDWRWLFFWPVRTASMTLCFTGTDRPEVRLYVGPQVADPPLRPVALPGREITVARQDFGPGVIDLRWAWPDDPPGVIQPIRRLPDEPG